MFVPFHLLKTYIRNLKWRWQPRSAREVSFARFLFLQSWFAKSLEGNFSWFAKIRWMSSWFVKLLELLLEHLQQFVKFYLANLVFCQPPKRYAKLKGAHLQPFVVIHLPNLDLTYTRNPERNKIMFMLFHLLKTCMRIPSLLLFLFSPSHLPRNNDANHKLRAYIYALEAVFSQVAKKCLLPNCWRCIFNVFAKKNQRWQIDLSNSRRCSSPRVS
jgi:hypothetical protein